MRDPAADDDARDLIAVNAGRAAIAADAPEPTKISAALYCVSARINCAAASLSAERVAIELRSARSLQGEASMKIWHQRSFRPAIDETTITRITAACHRYTDLHAAVGDLTEDQALDLIALMWLADGRAIDFDPARTEANRKLRGVTADYLLSARDLGKRIESGLAALAARRHAAVHKLAGFPVAAPRPAEQLRDAGAGQVSAAADTSRPPRTKGPIATTGTLPPWRKPAFGTGV
jgi:hypothetical protein